MLDADGILRHSLWSVTPPDNTEVPSLAAVTAAKYLAYQSGTEEQTADLDMVKRYLMEPPTDARGFWYLPFTGLPGDYSESISVSDILSGAVPADYFADRIVLIGPYAAGLQDSYPTAIDHAQPMYGVNIRPMSSKHCCRKIIKRKQQTAGSIWHCSWLQEHLACGCGSGKWFRLLLAGWW